MFACVFACEVAKPIMDDTLLLRRRLQGSRPPDSERGCTASHSVLLVGDSAQTGTLDLWSFGMLVSTGLFQKSSDEYA